MADFEEFCGGPLWNETQFLGEWPEFTPCFRVTILIWLPCGYLWLLLPYFLYDVTKRDSTNNLVPPRPDIDDVSNGHGKRLRQKEDDSDPRGGVTVIFFLKLMLTSLVFLCNLSHLLISLKDDATTATIVGWAMQVASYVLVTFMLVFERRRGRKATFPAFFFFCMNAVVGVIDAYSWVMSQALTIASFAKKGTTVGEIVNLMSVDCQRLQDIMAMIFFMWTTPYQIVIGVVLLYQTLGPAVFSGVVILLLMVPLNAWMGSKQKLIQEANLKLKDVRIRMVNEILNGMKTFVSIKRINKFLITEDLDESNTTWDEKAVPVGSLTAVVGPVGSGKTSLINAILGEMEKVKGTVTVKVRDDTVGKIRAEIRTAIDRVTSDTANTSADEFNYIRKEKRKKRRKQDRYESSGGLSEPMLMHESLEQSMTLTSSVKSVHPVAGRLIMDEKLETGKVKRDVFVVYGRAAGMCALMTAFASYAVNQGLLVMSSFWLIEWTEDPILLNASTRSTPEGIATSDYYMGIYGGAFGLAQRGALLNPEKLTYFFTLSPVSVFTFLAFNYLFWFRMVRAADRLHGFLLERLFHAPMSFFDQTPIGRILNRFSRDMDTVDNTLPLILRDWIVCAALIFVTLVVVLVQTPLFAVVLVPLVILYMLIQSYYVRTSRQLKRIESIARSPIYVHFSESITGAAVIRAYRAGQRFVLESQRRVDYNQVYYFASQAALRYVGVGEQDVPGLYIETSYIFLPQADVIIPDNRPAKSWPSKGVVEFNRYQTRYREGLDLVLKGVNCCINSGEKVGIVGRTGAGKSSLTLCLFRIIEAVNGSIIIDGVNIADIGLHDLRSRLTILPQDPVLFSGTLRMNIDPFDQYTDDQLWQAIERSHLKPFVMAQQERLMYQCGEEGSNLSVGQRQLVCLARALLRHTRILILDEATAAIDLETDTLIQNTIRESFKECTILAIAHRLNTIMDYDRIIVMDAGVIKEFDTPKRLIEQRGVFFSMCKDAGLAS
ncbi:canalicular multispecific organic anion transporter 1-like [Aplysia californica]|uniref:Canalicular multispecific organic anion transporter 1-like n=1 Tax=Aplysia californica TaxID=6500 RepID=A0ABM1W3T4_APLCA|nr:canalicular multispecific organic anion transporter 1-like [Aplysia californica]